MSVTTGAVWWGLRSIAAADPSAIWASGSEDVKYARLQYEMGAAREILAARGITAGSVVALQVAPSFTMLWWMFGIWAQGAQVLVLDSRMSPAERAAVLDRVRPQFLVASDTAARPLSIFTDDCGGISVERRDDGIPGDPDIMIMMCSSGTSGTPKVVVRTWASVLADVRRHAENPGMATSGERVYVLCPPNHAAGLFAGVLHGLLAGTSLVFPDVMLPDDLLSRACEADVHAMIGVPVHFDLLSRASGQVRPRSLRLAAASGDVLPVAVADRFARRYGIRVGQMYGMSEFGVIATDLTGDFAYPTVGRILDGVEVRVSDGELYIRTDRSPYLEADHAERFADGWLRTHDRGEIDPQTCVLTLRGRTDSVHNIGGLKVDLTEVETVLREHPKVVDALAFCRAPEAGQDGPPPMLEAYIAAVAAVSEEELTAWCRDRLSAFKLPRRWHIGPDIPRTRLGKAARNGLPVIP